MAATTFDPTNPNSSVGDPTAIATSIVRDHGYRARARIGRGAFLLVSPLDEEIDPDDETERAGVDQWINVGQLVNLAGVGATTRMHDVSSPESKWTRVRPGRSTASPMQVHVLHNPNLQSHQYIIALFEAKASRNWRFFTRRQGRSQAAYWHFQAYASKYRIDTTVGDAVIMMAELTVDGKMSPLKLPLATYRDSAGVLQYPTDTAIIDPTDGERSKYGGLGARTGLRLGPEHYPS